MGVPNSREYNYYHAPNSPLRILVKSKCSLFLYSLIGIAFVNTCSLAPISNVVLI